MNRKLLLIFTVLFSTCIFAQNQLDNSGFNNWTTNTHGDGYPTGWNTSINLYEYGVNYPDANFLNKTSDASDLNSGLKLTTSLIGFDVIFSYALLGSIGDNGPIGGVPFSTTVDSIVFDAKYDLLNDDTANVLVTFKLNGTPVDMNVFQLDGSQSAWTRYSFPVNSSNFSHDTLILGFTSGDLSNDMATDGSWLMVDNIRFKDGATEVTSIPNPSFEDWTDVIASETPDDWYTSNEVTAELGFASVVKTTIASEGSNAIELRPDTLYSNNGNIFFPGILIYGDENLNGKPFTASPSNFTGMYKWSPNGTDTANITLIFTNQGSYVAFASLEIISEQTSYTSFDIPITSLGDAPDSIVISIIGGKAGSILTLDNFQFNGGNVGVNAIHLSEATSGVYPNPTSSDAFLKIGLLQSSTVSYNVVNALGKTVSNINLGTQNAGSHSIDFKSQDFKSGVYFISVSIDGINQMHKFIKK